MKTINALKLAAAATAVVFSVSAWPQTDAASGTTAPAASAKPSKASVRKANRELAKKVRQALQKGGVDSAGMNVIAKNGVITLAGHVADASQIDKAASVAKGVEGVTSVKNVLTIQEGGQ
ncbi:BON domain-containing protein [Caballeronia cordobensis]|uniref:Transport-associated protein n=1 Tax=Caballeronia cordobensis TaxID=1353886 RepID=A0A158J4Z3_CABCO|nr:BON domain-containing protein [Caballeronia cordobensis]AET93116.1 transport-associated protein [Burkholderia sp. YI23]BAO89745.1 transport-associated protein [Burkholderia sp. RPE67]SAL63896.1 transport-associated protein [Caballeronia cordobensis]